MEPDPKYYSLVQRLSFFNNSGPIAVPATTIQPIGGTAQFILPLSGQQAFRVVRLTGVVYDPNVSGKLVLLSLGMSFGPVPFGSASRATMGQVVGGEGVLTDYADEELYFWSDFLAQGGLSPAVAFSLVGDISNTDIIQQTMQAQISALIEIYNVKTSEAHVGFY